MLAMPAYCLWRRELLCPVNPHRCRSLVLLGSVLILLFPVISATDDLHAMRSELEESSAVCKRMVGGVATGESGWSSGKPGHAPAAVLSVFSLNLHSEFRKLFAAPSTLVRDVLLPGPNAGRAPPPLPLS